MEKGIPGAMYREHILDLYRNPSNFGIMKNPTHKKTEYNSLCGDEITVQLLVKHGKIEDVKFNGSGCVISMVSASLLTEKIKDMSTEEIKKLDNKAGITFIDFDTLFLKDWGHIFEKDFDIGVTARNEYIKNNILRAYANGGVIFGKQTQGTRDACSYALKVMESGRDKDLPEYDKIFKTLEEGRPAHKTHKRETLRWWVDQVFLSALILKYFRFNKKGSIKDMVFYNTFGMKVGIFSCTKYNKLDPEPKHIESLIKKGNTYILHLKTKGRDKLRSIEKEIDKWMR